MLDVKTETKNLKLDVRHRAYKFALSVIELVDALEKTMSGKTLGGQLLRSATSIGANLIEAKASPSRKDFINYYHIALKSANETKFWLQLLRDSKKASSDKMLILLTEINEIASMIGASLLTLKGKREVKSF